MRRHTKIKLSYKGVETELFSVISVPQNLQLNKESIFSVPILSIWFLSSVRLAKAVTSVKQINLR
jgi:hypothetical protein